MTASRKARGSRQSLKTPESFTPIIVGKGARRFTGVQLPGPF